MSALQLALTTENGDLVGDLPIDALEVVSASESSHHPGRTSLAQMGELYEKLLAAARREGFSVVDDPVDFQLAVSRAVLTNIGQETITIPVTVRHQVEPDGAAIEHGDEGQEGIDFADLFGKAQSTETSGLEDLL